MKIELAGFEEFKAQLRNLPQHLAEEAGGIVMHHAEATAAKVYAEYHEVTGNLKKGVKIDQVSVRGAGAMARVRSTSRHAWLYEHGSAARHYVTAAGREHRTGKMWSRSAPAHTLARTAIRERRAMVEELIAMLQREGLTVTGHGG